MNPQENMWCLLLLLPTARPRFVADLANNIFRRVKIATHAPWPHPNPTPTCLQTDSQKQNHRSKTSVVLVWYAKFPSTNEPARLCIDGECGNASSPIHPTIHCKCANANLGHIYPIFESRQTILPYWVVAAQQK